MKRFQDNVELQQKFLSAVNKLADNVGSTMGPRGRLVLLQQRGRAPIATKDGVSVARFVDFDEPFENAAAQIIKQAAEETNSSAGDGTTTSTVLARAIYSLAQKFLVAGNSPIEVKRGIEQAVERLVYEIEESAEPITSLEDIINIATISANGDEVIGKLIGEAVDAIGKDGSITIKEAKGKETSIEVIDGFRFDGGVAAEQFITDESSNLMKHKNPLFLITDETIEKVSEVYPALEIAAREKRPLIIVAEDVIDEALAAMIMNAVKGTMKVAALKAPGFGVEKREILSDLAVSVGATFFSTNGYVMGRSLETVELKDLGQAERVESSRRKTTIVNGAGNADKISERIEGIEAQIVETEDMRDAERLQARITRLASSVAVIFVGGATQGEMIERKHRVEDALEAVRSAQVEGIVPGAGTALLRARAAIEEPELDNTEQEAGFLIMYEACEAPIRQILTNAGERPDIIIAELEESEDNVVYDLVSEDYVDAMEAGVIDSAKVVRCALQNAASAAGLLISTNYAVIETD